MNDELRTTKPMKITSGRGKELAELLRKELGLPARVKNFEVRFAVDELVMVRCEYIAEVVRDAP